MDDKVLEYQNYTVYFPEDILFDLNDLNSILFGLGIILEEIKKNSTIPQEQVFQEYCDEIVLTFNDFIINQKETSLDYFFYDEDEDHLLLKLDSE